MGSRQLTWEHMAHRKLRQKPCAHTKQKQKHMASKTNHQPCAKQDTNTQLMRILISRVFTQDMRTWKRTANKIHKLRATQHKTQHECMQPIKTQTAYTPQDTWTGEHTGERTQDHTLTQQDRTWSASVQTPTRTETQDMSAGIRTPCSNTKQGTQTRERMARAHSQPHDHMKTGHDGSVRALSQNPWMTPHRSDRTLTLR